MTQNQRRLPPKKNIRKNDLPIVPAEPAAEEKRLFNRELSWLEFNRRVLHEAMEEGTLPLERLKFLSIFDTNLDEFFMIRVSGLKEQIAEGVVGTSPDGMTAAEQFREVTKRVRPMVRRQVSYLHETVLPMLAAAGITVEPYKTLPVKDRKRMDKYFRDNVYPILTPQSVDSSHPFPYISNRSVNLGLIIEPDRSLIKKELKYLYRQKRFVRIKLPPSVPRLVRIGDKGSRFTLLDEIIAANTRYLFPHMKAGEPFVFRVTRDADIEVREDEAGDLMRTLERELQRRRFRFPVRLEVSAKMPPKMIELLMRGIGLTSEDVYKIDGFLNIPDLMTLYSVDKPHLKDPPIALVHSANGPDKKNIFDTLKRHDVFLHHPYTSFGAVTDFIAESAEDPDVQAIKMCLYRTGKDSPIVDSLIEASKQGKQVTALVELKARFDEENNIEWARRLENEGVHVVYGIHGLKTHSKVALVIRREKGKLCRYVHLGTGNYNPVTARLYTDLGLLTADEDIAADSTNLFNFLTGYSQEDDFRRLIVAPLNMRQRFVEFIRREVVNKKNGKDARIIAKVNSLTDEVLIEEMYKASKAGVRIDLIIRGICRLRPGVKGLSENIKVRSIVGRFLEHSRVFYFANGGGEDEEVYMGSADWMGRNLDRRVEVVTPVLNENIRRYLKDEYLDAYLRDSVNARELQPDGTYKLVSAKPDEAFDAQMYFVGKPMPF